MSQVKLGEAARLTGRAKSTIHRAMETGRLSYTLAGDGERLIDPAELARVFAFKPEEAEEVAPRNSDETAGNQTQPADIAPLVAQLAAERARAAGLEGRLADLQETVADLRRRLDCEGEERRQAQARLTALLTDQRSAPRRWWSWRRR